MALELGDCPGNRYQFEEPKKSRFYVDLLQVRSIEQGFRKMGEVNLGSFSLLNKVFGPLPSRWACLLALTLLHSAKERPEPSHIDLFREFIPGDMLHLAFVKKQKLWGEIEL
jgi:hypothetical protein